MDLTLRRLSIEDQGAFSYLLTSLGSQIACTVERTFGELGAPAVVLQPGEYVCVRGEHSLDGIHRFETFEVTGVSGHSGILFHSGNWETDSKGCIIVGEAFGTLGERKAVVRSVSAFHTFLDRERDVESFMLTVEDSTLMPSAVHA